MEVILDTNALSALADGDPALGAALKPVTGVAVTVITLGEYRYGIRLSRHRTAHETWLDTVLGLYRILPVDDATTVSYALLRHELKRVGRLIPTNDLWIAAIAKQHGLPVVSRDRHFDAVQGLHRIAW